MWTFLAAILSPSVGTASVSESGIFIIHPVTARTFCSLSAATCADAAKFKPAFVEMYIPAAGYVAFVSVTIVKERTHVLYSA